MDDAWEPPLPPGYNDASRAFIQAFMARGSLTFKEGQRVLAAIKSADDDSDEPPNPDSITIAEFQNFIRSAREAVEPLDFDIRNTRDQVRVGGERVWAFVNAHSDPATQMSTSRSPEEVAYIKRLLDAMFETYNTPRMEVMAVDEGQALRVSRPSRQRESNVHENGDGEEQDVAAAATTDRGLKHSEVLSLLSSLVAEGWLIKSLDGFYSLTPRSLMELRSWLVETYNDPDADAEWQQIKFCEACKEIVTHGQRCNDPACMVRLHDICEEAFWRTRPEKKCLRCSTAWEGTHFVGSGLSRPGQGSRGQEEEGGDRGRHRRLLRRMRMRNDFLETSESLIPGSVVALATVHQRNMRRDDITVAVQGLAGCLLGGDECDDGGGNDE